MLAAHYEGLGHMERYEYPEAVVAFRDVRKGAPGWIPGSINLAIALLNDSGVKAEAAKKAGIEAPSDNFGEALEAAGGRAEPAARQPIRALLPRDHSGAAREPRRGIRPLQARDRDRPQ